MKRKVFHIPTGDYLRCEIQPDGSRAALYEGQLLVYLFEWLPEKRVFEITCLNSYYEKLMTQNSDFKTYFNLVLYYLEDYHSKAAELAERRKKTEKLLSDFVAIEKPTI